MVHAIDLFPPLLSGFGLGASLIIAIGSQNAFVLRQGLKRQYIFTVCTICFLCDSLLISLGAGGFSTVVASSPLFLKATLWSGVLFLFGYGLRSFTAALRPGSMEVEDGAGADVPLRQVVLMTVSFSLLNPHAFLDTVLLLGSLASQYRGLYRLAFAVGAMAASLTWFYGIGFGARLIAPLFRKPQAWRMLDIMVGCTMWGIAFRLAFPAR